MALSWAECALIVFLLILPVFWHSSHVLRYYVKSILFQLWIMLSASLIIPFAVLKPNNVANVGYIQWLWRKTLGVFGLTLELRNTQDLNYDKPRIIVSNHQSSLDLIAMMEVMPPRTTALAKKELIYAGPFGIACWLSGIIFVDRSNSKKAHETLERTAEIMHERQVSIWIYPEGRRNYDGHLLKFKKGAFNLAVQAKVPIFPIVFSSYRDFLCKKRKILNPGKVIVNCLPMIPTVGLTMDDVPSLTEKTYLAMEAAFEAISNEMHEQAVKDGTSIIKDSDN